MQQTHQGVVVISKGNLVLEEVRERVNKKLVTNVTTVIDAFPNILKVLRYSKIQTQIIVINRIIEINPTQMINCSIPICQIDL